MKNHYLGILLSLLIGVFGITMNAYSEGIVDSEFIVTVEKQFQNIFIQEDSTVKNDLLEQLRAEVANTGGLIKLKNLINSEDKELRKKAIRFYLWIVEGEDEDVINKEIQDPDYEVRMRVLFALQVVSAEQYKKYRKILADDFDPQILSGLINSIREKAEKYKDSQQFDNAVSWFEFPYLEVYGVKATPELVKIVKDKNEPVFLREKLLHLLGFARYEGQFVFQLSDDFLLDIVRDKTESDRIRSAALHSLPNPWFTGLTIDYSFYINQLREIYKQESNQGFRSEIYGKAESLERTIKEIQEKQGSK